MPNENAPGSPGIDPTWCSSAKDLVTTALGASRVWVTLGYGILNEVFWPSTGQPQIRDLGFIVAGGGRWTELKRLGNYTVATPEPYVPLPTIVHRGEGFTVTLEIAPDDRRDVVLVRYRLEQETSSDADRLRLYPLLAPRLGSRGRDNTAWVEHGALMASQGDCALCLQDTAGFARGSAGYVGRSDGWQDFRKNGRMDWTYPRAEQGNVALMGELDAQEGVLAIGFSGTVVGAHTLVGSSLAEGFGAIRDRALESWTEWGESLRCPGDAASPYRSLTLRSATVLKVCEDRHFPGAVVASLSIPWGNSHDDLGGYHLVWARDSVEAGFGMIAAQHYDEARSMASYLIATQQEDGHWSQNFYPDGTPYWKGVQLDEAAFPILLVAKLYELGQGDGLTGAEAMVRRAAGFLIRSGPISPQDRWEENAGISPFTLAVTIAALVAAAELLSDSAERDECLAYADFLNRRVEDWLYVRDTELCKKYGVDGYYLRMAVRDIFAGRHGPLPIANRGGLTLPAEEVVSLDYLYLARLGLRPADDPRMRATLKVIEGELAVDTPNGVSYHRYNEDGYGEHADGAPFDGQGIGRLWPLLTGERGHLAVQQGEDAAPYLRAMAAMTGPGGMLPEQVWDAPAIPARRLTPGAPTGSAMPLLWAHAEFMKLVAAQHDGKPIELLDAVAKRWGAKRPEPAVWRWRPDAPFEALPPGVGLRVEDGKPFRLHYAMVAGGGDLDGDWPDVQEARSQPAPFGMYAVGFAAKQLKGLAGCKLTLFYEEANQWEGVDHTIALGG
ncbi:Glucoamylase precursor [Pirellulimonas nuda]|uniref:Glucoamylase n=1 Tax=Pirellulimonas nuda TaxID=2528009 RepID=A0A518D8U2_9BACT|nr:glycoside hydrolase family 15 protein [Pirellulimonas nuda]QDU87901.1 Glucoamylase precursor [Pirellulimonas nuda]